jgi:hypothetical protein
LFRESIVRETKVVEYRQMTKIKLLMRLVVADIKDYSLKPLGEGGGGTGVASFALSCSQI